MTLGMIKQYQCYTHTENGARALSTTGSALLDFFSMAGAMRRRSADAIALSFQRALIEDAELGLKLAFYTRDTRMGLGERRTGRILFELLAKRFPDYLRPYLSLIPEYGRWDDLFVLLSTPLREEVISLIQKQLEQDFRGMLEGRSISLLAKWMPSVNTSSEKTRSLARLLIHSLGMKEKTYRKILSPLRAYLNVTEVRLSEKDMDAIRYAQVPSLAMRKYRRAFLRSDGERFQAYLESVENGCEKINSSVLFPYELVEPYLSGSLIDPVLEAQWKALPALSDSERRFLVIADTSGSMHGRPIAMSIGLALYFAERCTGPFHNTFMTFSARPELVHVEGASLFERVLYARNADWEMNTDLEAALLLVLKSAVSGHAKQSDLPEALLVITDMEIDDCSCTDSFSFADGMKDVYRSYGYEMPEIVFWNVDARHNTFLADARTEHVKLASGASFRVFESLLKGEALTPYQHMVETLNAPRYSAIKLPV